MHASNPIGGEGPKRRELRPDLWSCLFWSAALLLMPLLFACSTPDIQAEPHELSHFQIYFNNDRLTQGETVCDAVFPVSRATPSSSIQPSLLLETLFLGPTPDERIQGYHSFFSERTAGLLRRMKIEAGTAYIDLHDLRTELSGITSSCGGAEFFNQIERTLAVIPGIARIIFAIEGNPKAFYDWMEMECDARNDQCDPRPFGSP